MSQSSPQTAYESACIYTESTMNRNGNPKAMVKRPRQNSRKLQGMTRRSAATIPRPPQIDGYEITHTRTLRFYVSVATSASITYQNLLDTILMGTTSTQLADLFYAVRINSVKIWTVPTIGTSVTAQVVFEGTTAGMVGDRTVHTSNSMGIEPAFLSCRPDRRSLASQFQVSSNNEAFQIVAEPGSIVDVSLSFRSDVRGNIVIAQNPGVALTVGAIVYRGLDGKAIATTAFAPPAGILTA